MSKSYRFFSLIILAITIIWLLYELSLWHYEKWHFLTAGAIHFLMAVIINRQFVKSDYNYLGLIHIGAAILFFGYGYFFL